MAEWRNSVNMRLHSHSEVQCTEESDFLLPDQSVAKVIAMKAYKVIFPLLVIISIILSCSSSSTKPEREEIIVTGNITEDTVWESGKDYVIEGEVVVVEGVKLMIDPDVMVRFLASDTGNSKMIINGQISVNIESSTKKSVFKGDDENLCSVEVYDSKAMNCFNNCEFEAMNFGVKVYNSHVIINNSIFKNCENGVYLIRAKESQITSCLFNQCIFGVKVELAVDSSSCSLQNNDFSDCTESAIEISNNSIAHITGNNIHSSNVGVSVTHHSFVKLNRNVINNCGFACFFYRSGTGFITRNTISDCISGLYLEGGSYPIINFNNIINNEGAYIKMGIGQWVDVDAKNNWWGGISEEFVSEVLHDAEDEDREDISYVIYIPFLTEPVEETIN